jgi:multidrug resistance efflux pump
MNDDAQATKKPVIPLVIVALLALAYGGYRLYQWRRPYEWSGTVEARTIDVGSRVGGRVKEVLAHEGQRVSERQPLLILEPGDLFAQRLAADGQLAQAQAQLEKLERGARPEEIEQARARAVSAQAAYSASRTGARREQIAGARARLEAANVAFDKARLDLDRVEKLFSSGAASQAERDNAEIQLKSMRAQRDAVKEQFTELESGSRSEDLDQAAARAREAEAMSKMVRSGSRVEDIKAARGLVDAAQGRLDQIKVLIEELTVVAPRAARVEALDLRPGDILPPSATAAKLLEEDQLYVRVYVPETQLGFVKVGQEVPINVDSFPGRSFKGVVEHVAAVGEFSPRNLQTADERADQVFATRIGLRDGRDVLKAGMAAFVQVPK